MTPTIALDALSEFLQGHWITGIFYPYFAVIGDWFFAIVMLTVCMGIYIKTSTFLAPTVLLVLGAGVIFALLPPEAHKFAYLMIALSITGVLFKLFRSR